MDDELVNKEGMTRDEEFQRSGVEKIGDGGVWPYFFVILQ